MGFERTLVAVAIASILEINYVSAAPSLETISDYARVAKNEKPTATEAPSARTTSTGFSPNETTEFTDYEDFDDVEEDRSLKQVSTGESMIKLFTGLVSLMGLLQAFKNVHHQSNPSPGLKPEKLYFKSASEPRKFEKNAQERFLPHHLTQNNENVKDQEFQPVENYPPYNPLTANSAESYAKEGRKTSYEVYNSENAIDHYNHKDEIEVIPSNSYEIQYETPKPLKQTSGSDEMSWNDQNIRPVYQPWMSEVQNSPPQPSIVDSYLPWSGSSTSSGKIQNMIKSQTNNLVVDNQPPWQGKIPPDDFSMYSHTKFKNPPSPPLPPALPDHHFEYEEIDHPEVHPVEEDRVNKKPYSYYFLGRKLWYIPLIFSVYFIVYVGALVLKSVARHKIQFPEKVWDLHDHHADHVYGHGKNRRQRRIDEVTETVENSIYKMRNKFM